MFQELLNHKIKLEEMFRKHKKEIDDLEEKPECFKNHMIPLARIKKIMKSDEDVKVGSRKLS